MPVQMNPFDGNNSEPNYWLSCMIIDKDAMCHQVRDDKNAFYTSEPGKSCPTEILEVLSAFNAEGRPIWKPMHMQPIYRMNPYVTKGRNVLKGNNANINDSKTIDVGADIFSRGLCLPSDNKMTIEQQNIVLRLITQCFV